MKTVSVLFLLLFTGFYARLAPAQTLALRHYTIADGLPQTVVYAIAQDQQGQLWAGTQGGVCWFDGQHFHTLDARQGLPDNHVTAVTTAPDQTMWFGHEYGGVSYYRQGQIHSFRPPGFGQQTHVKQLVAVGSHTLWIATASKGLFRVSWAAPDTLVQHLTTRQGLPSDTVNQLSRGPAGQWWVATAAGLAVLDSSGTLQADHTLPERLRQQAVHALFRMTDQLIWCATDTGLVKLTRDRTHPWQAQRFTVANGLCANRVLRVVQDRLGRVWAATAAGLSRSDADGFSCFGGRDYLISDQANDLLEDREGNLWLVQDNGLVQHTADEKFTLFSPQDGLPDNQVHAILRVAADQYWIGTRKGLTLYRPNAPAGHRFAPLPLRAGLLGNFIKCLYQDSKGRIWLGSRGGGAACYTPASKRWQYFDEVPSLAGQRVVSIGEDRRGRIWLATLGKGVTVLDLARPTARPRVFDAAHGLGSASVWKVFRDHRGTLWLGTDDIGLVEVDTDRDQFRRVTGAARLSIGSISEDGHGDLWLGSIGRGLLRYDGHRVHSYNLSTGLQSNNPFFVQCDSSGQVWLGTNLGLDCFNPRTGRAVNYGLAEGFLGQETNQNAVLLDGGGRLWAGTINGLMRYDPRLARPNTVPPRTRLTGLRIFLKDTSLVPGLTLPHVLNHLTFDFVGVSLTNPGKVRYQYRLVGFDQGWVAPTSATSATYTNVPPGTYTFQVRAANNDGVWNPQPVAFLFTVRPPWWRTWWAYGLYVLSFAAVLYAVRTYTVAHERLRTDRQLERLALTHLQELDKVKTEFFTNVSHELRTPLTLILGPAEQLATEPTDAAVRQQGGLVLRHARKLLHLINQLLDLSKLEVGALQLTPTAGDLVPFTQHLLGSFTALAEAQQLTLRLHTPVPRLLFVFDANKLEEALSNLLLNALKFTPAGGEIALELQDIPSGPDLPTGAVDLTVRDTGIGIAAQHLPHLFDRFYQASLPDATSVRTGTGIGLALVKELTELHGGTVSVISQPGRGTAFTLRLPRHLAPVSSAESLNVPMPKTVLELETPILPAAMPTPDADVVLVIEDNAEVRHFILGTLQLLSYQLLEASDGAAGVALAQEQVPDLVISDVMMPGLTGYEVCQQLKTDERTSHIPVVLLTAKSTAEDKLLGLETGADSYLAKPFNPRELRAQVRNLLDLRHRLRALYANAEVTAIDEHAVAIEGRPSLDQAFLQRVRAAVEHHLDDGEFSVESLSTEVGMSRTQLHRKLKALTGQAASDFIRSTRLHRAHALLQAQVATVSEVAYQVGFNNPAHFSTSFSKQFGYAPSEVRKRAVPPIS